MSFFLRDNTGSILGEYNDLASLKTGVQASGFPAGQYSIYKFVSTFHVKEVPSRISMQFESVTKRGPRKPKVQAVADADSTSAPEPGAPKKRKGFLG
jgi:hypothetical protein